MVISRSSNATARVYNITAARVTHVLEHPTTVTKAAFSVDSRRVVTLDADREVSISDLSPAVRVHRISLAGNTWPHSLDFNPDGSIIFFRDPDGQIQASFAIHRPPTQIWPAYHMSDDGWVAAKCPGPGDHIVGWLPSEWRVVFTLGRKTFCALDAARKHSVAIDVSQTAAYAKMRGRLKRAISCI